MSLSNLLIKSVKDVDTELDSLFKSNPVAPAPTAGFSMHSEKKRKLSGKQSSDIPHKRAKSKLDIAPKTSPEKREEKPKSVKSSRKAGEEKKMQKSELEKPRKADKGKVKDAEPSDNEDDNSDLENTYIAGKETTEPSSPKDDEASDEGEDYSQMVHESMNGKAKKGSRSKQKYIPAKETSEQRDQRTIFVGNLPIDIAQKKPLLKQLHRHIQSLVPNAKVESTRFRSIAFQAPTAQLPASDDEDSSKKPKAKPAVKQVRPHNQERTSQWRSQQADEEEVQKDEKKFLNPSQKKKIAFINQEFHSKVASMNAYIVFAHPIPAEDRPANLPPPSPVMDPYEAARETAEKCDGTMFMDRMLRVDLVGKSKAGPSEVKNSLKAVETDPKLSVFVGNLDFATKDEDLRAFFEGVVSTERGPPPPRDDDAVIASAVKKPSTWVTRIRIVRDKDTQLGKGFGYVQFAERECVDELLALEEEKLKFAKRKLRVQRCKTVTGTSTSTVKNTSSARPASVPIVVPRGDPLLGEKLAHLPKDERKQIKSTDIDRVARRLAKKKARNAMGTGAGAVKAKGKERERVRKGPSTGKPKPTAGKNSSKGRVRSEKSVAKRNMKK